MHTTPKLVGGVTDECLRRTKLLYETIVQTVVPVSSPMVAETAKLHENTFRAVNIALANELALMCDQLGITPWEVIEAASSKPFGFLPHYPGPGLGGDCIPVVPHFLAWRLREYGYSAQLIDAAHEVNAMMPNFVLQKIADALNDGARPIKGSRILLLGVTYKADVADTRESPSLEVLRQLAQRGGDVRYCDPHIPTQELDDEIYEAVRGAPRRSPRPTGRDAHRAPGVPRGAPLGGRARSSWTPGTSFPRGHRLFHLVAAVLLILGAGYIGAAVAELALGRGRRSCSPTTGTRPAARSSTGSRRRGARVETADIRDREALDALLAGGPRRVLLLAAQASRPISEREPDYTEETNLTGARRVAEAVAASAAAARARQLAARLREPALAARSAPTRPTASRATSRTSRRSTPSSRSACTPAAAASGSRLCGSGSSTARARSSTTRPSPDRRRQVPPPGRGRRAADARRRRPRDDRRGPRRRRGAASCSTAAVPAPAMTNSPPRR